MLYAWKHNIGFNRYTERQEKQETVPSYVMRACAIMEKTQKSGEGVKTSAKLAEEAAEKARTHGKIRTSDNGTNRIRKYPTYK
ncbi:hypothetical protein DOY81_011217 [Sarcophaga bullata]|nr:hypothetical protein DOY81_011217 [Sarcophaga bullata]